MAQEEIVVKIREDGSVVVSKALKDLAHQSDKAGESVDLTNKRLRGVSASSAEAKRGLDNVSRSTSLTGSSFDRLIVGRNRGNNIQLRRDYTRYRLLY